MAPALRWLGRGLVLALVLAAALLLTWRAGVSPWWSLLLLGLALLAWWLLGLAARAWRARERHPRAPRAAGDCAIEQSWRRAMQQAAVMGRGRGLPWFLLLGRAGAGKTSALTQASLSSPLAPVLGADAQGRGFGWWTTDGIVLVDCGDALPQADAAAPAVAAWQQHLRMLRRERRRDGLHGVLVALSASRLLTAPADELAAEARATRAGLQQLIEMFGQRVPVYLLLTHCDAIPGLRAWTDALGDGAAPQALGYLADVDSAQQQQQQFVQHAFDALDQRLRRLRWTLLAAGPDADPGLLLFPMQLQALRAPLQDFADNGLAPHPYLEPLLLRGLFVSSAMQAPEPPPDSLPRATRSAPEAEPRAAQRPRGWFLQQLFTKVLPSDIDLRRPSTTAARRRRVRARLLLVAWIGSGVAGSAVLAVSAQRNLQSLHELRGAPSLVRDASLPFASQVRTLAAREAAIRRFEARGRRPLDALTLPASGWSALLERQQHDFVAACDALDEAPAHPGEQPAAHGDGAQQSDPLQQRARAMLPLLRLAEALQARRGGASLEQLEALAPGLASAAPEAPAAKQAWRLRLARLAWTARSDPSLDARWHEVRGRLDATGLGDPTLRWLLALPRLSGVAPLRQADAWERMPGPASGGSAPQGPELAPEYTAAGHARMHELVTRWREVSGEPARLDAAWAGFRQAWLEQQRAAARSVLEQLPHSALRPQAGANWRAALPRLAGIDHPSWHFSQQLLEQLTRPAQSGSRGFGGSIEPAWLNAAREFQLWRAQAAGQAAAGDALAAVRTVGMRSLQRGAAVDPAGAALNIEADVQGVRSLRAYLGALARLAHALEQDEARAGGVAAAYAAACAAPAETARANDAAADPSVALTRDALRAGRDVHERLHAAVPLPPGDDEIALDALLDAPWRSLIAYAQATAGCRLQRQWRSDVLWPLQTAATRDDKLQQVYGPQGTLWSFVDGPAAQFLRRDTLRYQPVVAPGDSPLFTAEFIDLLNRAARRRAQLRLEEQRGQQSARAREDLVQQLQASQQQLRERQAQLLQQRDALLQSPLAVTLTTLPSDVEPASAPRVHDTLLSLECTSGATQLDNPNLPPQTRAFVWSPRSCSTVRLRISVDGIDLERVYPGPLGFAEFLAEFHAGNHGFDADDFPQQAPRLRELGVRRITLHYRIDGAQAVLGTADALRSVESRDAELSRELRDLEQRRQQLQRPAGPAVSAADTSSWDPADDAMRLGLPATITTCPEHEAALRGAT